MQFDHFLVELGKVEEGRGEYSRAERKLLFQSFRSLSWDDWGKLCENVLKKAKGNYKIALGSFDEVYRAAPAEYKKIQKVSRGQCKDCDGYGIVYLLQEQEVFGAQMNVVCVARCTCPNAANWCEKVPTITRAEQHPNFVMRLDPHNMEDRYKLVPERPA